MTSRNRSKKHDVILNAKFRVVDMGELSKIREGSPTTVNSSLREIDTRTMVGKLNTPMRRFDNRSQVDVRHTQP
jgi:hypothetical protein